MRNGAIELEVAGFATLGIARTGGGGRAGIGVLRVGLICRWVDNRRRRGRGRGVRQRARNTARIRATDLVVFANLTRTNGGLVRIAIRTILFVGLLFIIEVHLRGDLRMHVTVTDDRPKNRFNTALNAAFNVGGVFQLRVVQVASAGIGLGQQMAALIDHGDVARR